MGDPAVWTTTPRRCPHAWLKLTLPTAVQFNTVCLTPCTARAFDKTWLGVRQTLFFSRHASH
jgi:hypothetical protein